VGQRRFRPGRSADVMAYNNPDFRRRGFSNLMLTSRREAGQ
jgi:hypothetical protein